MPATTPRIEELRVKLKADPKSRLFYPLGDELRKIGSLEEAEQVLRAGLEYHPTYLSGWVSLGRVLRERGDNARAAEVLAKALQLDPGNVVAARLLAEAHLEMGDKVEALNKFKLVQALLPADQEIEATIQRIERDLAPPTAAPLSAVPAEAVASEAVLSAEAAAPRGAAAPKAQPVAAEESEAPAAPEPAVSEESPFALAGSAPSPVAEELPGQGEPGPPAMAERPAEPSPWLDEPSAISQTPPVLSPGAASGSAGEESPWAESGKSPFAAQPAPGAAAGSQLPPAPAAEAADIFAAAAEPPEGEAVAEEPFQTHREVLVEQQGGTEVVSDTITMAELYARQGLIEDARNVYQRILARDPDQAEARKGLEMLEAGEFKRAPGTDMSRAARLEKVARLEQWLARVKGGSHV
jgi:tetratricopeptide (TPR) repeat protein